MSMFELLKATGRITHVQARVETHGNEAVPAMDVKVAMVLGVDCLAMFGPQLRDSLFGNAGNGAGDLAGDGTPLRNPCIEPPIAIAWEGVGYDVSIDYGLKDAIAIPMATVDKVGITPRDGGTVEVEYRIRSSQISETNRGRLTGMMRRDVSITATPPSPSDAVPKGKDAAPKASKRRSHSETSSASHALQ